MQLPSYVSTASESATGCNIGGNLRNLSEL